MKVLKSICLSIIFTGLINSCFSQYDSLARIHFKTYHEFSVHYKSGLLNIKTGDTLLKPLYGKIDVFSEGLARVQRINSVGYIDSTGHFVIPLGQYQSPGGGSVRGLFLNGIAIVKKGDLFGAINKKGEVVIPFAPRELLGTAQNTIITYENKKYGLIGIDNELLFNMVYDRLWKYGGLIYLKKNDKMAIANLKGQLLTELAYDEISPNRYGGVILRKNGKEGYALQDGQQVIDCQFDKIMWFDPKHKTVWLKNKGLFTIMDTDGAVLANIPDGDVHYAFTTGNPIGISSANTIQYFDPAGQPVGTNYKYLDENYSGAYHFREGKCIVNQNKKWGMINQDGEVIIPFEYDRLTRPSPLGHVLAKKGKLYGLLDTNNTVVLKFRERSLNSYNYRTRAQLDKTIEAEAWLDAVSPRVKVKQSKAVSIAKQKKMYYDDGSSEADNCILKEENGRLLWEIKTYERGYTRKGDCANTNGCTITYVKLIKIDATSGKVIDRKSSKSMFPNYE